jgi:hypothetical protein
MNNNIDSINKEIERIKVELVMDGYLDGWTKKFLTEKLLKLYKKLEILTEK